MEEQRPCSRPKNMRVRWQATQPLSHHPVAPSSRNKHPRFRRHRSILSHNLLIAVFLMCCLPLCSATSFRYNNIEEQLVEPSEQNDLLVVEVETPDQQFERLAKSGIILVDPSPHPQPLNYGSADLVRRADSDSSSSITATATSLTPSATSGGAISTAAATASMSDLPIPFDSGFSSNVTASCSDFMNDMLGNATFKSCLPFSLLLQVS